MTTGWQSKISRNFHSNGVRRSQPRKGGQPLYSLANSVVCVLCVEHESTVHVCILGFETFGKQSKEPPKAKEAESKSKQGTIKLEL